MEEVWRGSRVVFDGEWKWVKLLIDTEEGDEGVVEEAGVGRREEGVLMDHSNNAWLVDLPN